jgi:hypothetical protein
MHRGRLLATGAGVTAAIGCAAAGAAMMHPVLGAHLAGMGSTGVVTLHANSAKGTLCWSFELPAHGLTGASIRDGAGMEVVRLGPMYTAKGCASVSPTVLNEVETMPGAYHVWVATKNHPGDLRGTLFAGMAHMAQS